LFIKESIDEVDMNIDSQEKYTSVVGRENKILVTRFVSSKINIVNYEFPNDRVLYFGSLKAQVLKQEWILTTPELTTSSSIKQI
jgi:hypothetical protein